MDVHFKRSSEFCQMDNYMMNKNYFKLEEPAALGEPQIKLGETWSQLGGPQSQLGEPQS